MTAVQACIDDRCSVIKSYILQTVKILEVTLWPSDKHLLTEFGNKEVGADISQKLIFHPKKINGM